MRFQYQLEEQADMRKSDIIKVAIASILLIVAAVIIISSLVGGGGGQSMPSL